MKNKHFILALVLAVIGLLLAILQFRQQSPPPATEGKQTRRPRPPESQSAVEPKNPVDKDQLEDPKEYLFGENVVELNYKNSRFIAANMIKMSMTRLAFSRESYDRSIVAHLRMGWPNIYDAPLNVEFWEFGFQQGIDREKIQEFRRPSDNPDDWPTWIEQIKQALATGESLESFRRDPNRPYATTNPNFSKSLLDPESPTRKRWEDPELQRIAALVDRMIKEVDWPAWPNQPDWELIVGEYIISEIPDVIDAAAAKNPIRFE